jgi:hypothetical protein
VRVLGETGKHTSSPELAEEGKRREGRVEDDEGIRELGGAGGRRGEGEEVVRVPSGHSGSWKRAGSRIKRESVSKRGRRGESCDSFGLSASVDLSRWCACSCSPTLYDSQLQRWTFDEADVRFFIERQSMPKREDCQGWAYDGGRLELERWAGEEKESVNS